MKLETMLEIQSSVDGQLDNQRRQVVARLVSSDTEARQLHQQLTAVRMALREHEPAIRVPESREFYWSQLERRLQVREQVHPPALHPATTVWRWLAPMMGVSAVIAVFALQPFATTGLRSFPAGSGNPQATTVTFSSEADGVTIHWIN
jgi:anti-sigma factor RsiW